MFDNLEGKLRGLGTFAFIGGIIATIAMVSMSEIFEVSVILGLLFMAFGVLVSWLGSLLYFAIAKILEDTAAIRYSVSSVSGVSQYAKVNAPTAPVSDETVAPASSEPVMEKLSVVTFVATALEYRYADGTMAYVKKNFVKLSDEDKEKLAVITPYIAKNDAENLRSGLEALRWSVK